MRVLYLDDDEDKMNPILVKIPLTVLSPSPNMLKLLVALERFYGVGCYLTIVDIEESPGESISLIPFGVATSEAMLITTCYDNVQYLYGITSAYGEYELLAMDDDGHYMGLLVDQDLISYLKLEYVDEITNLHRKYLESINCGDDQELVYFPRALY